MFFCSSKNSLLVSNDSLCSCGFLWQATVRACCVFCFCYLRIIEQMLLHIQTPLFFYAAVCCRAACLDYLCRDLNHLLLSAVPLSGKLFIHHSKCSPQWTEVMSIGNQANGHIMFLACTSTFTSCTCLSLSCAGFLCCFFMIFILTYLSGSLLIYFTWEKTRKDKVKPVSHCVFS